MLTMRGQAQPATLEVPFNGSLAHHPLENTAKLGFSASTTIQRSQWGLDFVLPVLGDDVRIDVETQMVPHFLRSRRTARGVRSTRRAFSP